MGEHLNVRISSTGMALPGKRLTNMTLEKMVDTSDDWIVSRTGIKERRILDEQWSASDLAVVSAREALDNADLKPHEIDLIIVATATPDHLVPATACIVQSKLNAFGCPAFDINAGCSGFVYGLVIGQQFIENCTYKNILVIGVDILSRITNWEDRSTCVLFGDGAGAVVLQPSNDAKGVLSVSLMADGEGAEHLMVPAGGSYMPANENTVKNKLHFVKMNGNEVFKFAVNIVVETINILLNKSGLSIDQLHLLFLHQANHRIIEAARKKLNISPHKLPVNIERFGNMSAASIPVLLHENVREGHIERGDLIAMVAFGAGLTCGGVLLEW